MAYTIVATMMMTIVLSMKPETICCKSMDLSPMGEAPSARVRRHPVFDPGRTGAHPIRLLLFVCPLKIKLPLFQNY